MPKLGRASEVDGISSAVASGVAVSVKMIASVVNIVLSFTGQIATLFNIGKTILEATTL
jgi:hypothetical protein